MHGYKWYLYLSTWNSLFVSITVWYLSYNIMNFFLVWDSLCTKSLFPWSLCSIRNPWGQKVSGEKTEWKRMKMWQRDAGCLVGIRAGVMAKGHCAEALASSDWTPKRIWCHLLHHSKSDLERQARPQSWKALDVLSCHLLGAKLWEISKIKFGFDNSSE